MNDVLPLSPTEPELKTKSSIALPRLGFLGLGWIGRSRLESVARSAVAEISVLADPTHSSLSTAREIAPEAAVAGSLEELFEFDLDGVVIATPNALHAEQVMAALNYGCAVFCQKPMGRTAGETRDVIVKAREVNCLLKVDLCYRHTTGMKAIRQLIRAGELGEIYAVEMVFHNAYGPDKPWFYDARLSGGGCLIDLGTHLIDLALWCLGFPKVEHAMGIIHKADSTQVEDYAGAQLQLSNGASVQLACSWKAPAGCDALIEATFFGTKSGARFHNVNGSFHDFRAEQLLANRTRKMLAMPPDDWGARGIVTWVDQLATSPGFDVEIETVLGTATTIDALYNT